MMVINLMTSEASLGLTPWLDFRDLVFLVFIINIFLLADIIILNLLISKRSVVISFLGFKLILGEPIKDCIQKGSRRK